MKGGLPYFYFNSFFIQKDEEKGKCELLSVLLPRKFVGIVYEERVTDGCR